MPMTVNVGLSRKRSANYNSDGVTISLSAELDQALLTQPSRLQGEVAKLYTQAREAIERESCGEDPAPIAGRVGQHSNGHTRSGSGGVRPITPSQTRALHAIASKHHLELDSLCEERFGKRHQEVSIREASELIDHIKKEVA